MLIDVARAVRDAYGHQYALAMVEDVRAELRDPAGTFQTQLNLFHSALYEDWLDLLLARDDTVSAQQVFVQGRSRFPGNPRIHLFA